VDRCIKGGGYTVLRPSRGPSDDKVRVLINNPCSAARNAVAGVAVPGERAPAVAAPRSPSEPQCGDCRCDHPVDLARYREAVPGGPWAQPSILCGRGRQRLTLTFLAPAVRRRHWAKAGSSRARVTPPIGQSDGAQDLPLLSM
jgi:hypothetical protein